MQVIAIGQRKGGVGKTTLAINVAAEIARQGRAVSVIDADPQGSALLWAEPRRLPFRVRQDLLAAKTERIWIRDILKTPGDIVIIDMPAGFDQTFETSVLIADLLVIPCGASSIDINSAKQTILKTREVARLDAGTQPKSIIVPTRVDGAIEEGQQIVDELRRLGETVGPLLSYNIAFVRSFAAGSSVSALAPGGSADLETRRLTTFLLDELALLDPQS